MFSSLPKLADKQFVIGFICPVLIFGLVLVAFLAPHGAVAKTIASLHEKDVGDLAAAVAGLWLAALVLMLANRLIFRLVSGYWWPLRRWFGYRALRHWWSEELAWLNAEFDRLGTLSPEARKAARADYNRRLWRFRQQFPREESLLLGTRFGNVMRAFELYPNQVYGVDGVAIAPRLDGVIPKDFQASLSDARCQVDCFVNLSFLAWVLAAIVIGSVAVEDGLLAMRSVPIAAPSWAWFVWIVGACLAAWVFYEMAIERGVALGERVRSAVDLYLPALVTQLGHELPKTLQDRDRLWEELAGSFLYFAPAQRLWVKAGPAKKALGGGAPEAGGADDD